MERDDQQLLKPQTHQAYDQGTTYLRPKNGSIVERTYDWSQRSYDWSQWSWVIASGKSVAARSWSCSKSSHTGLIPPSHRRRGVTAVLVRHKPQWHRHDRRGSTVVPSLIVVAPRKTVKTADLRGGTTATFNMFRRASAVLVPSHRRRGATAVLVRHKPH